MRTSRGTGTVTLAAVLPLLARGEERAAQPLLESIVRADGRNVDAWYLLAGVHHRAGAHDAAAAAYASVVALDPRHADAHYFLGNLHGQRGEHEAAARCFAAAVECRPQWPEAVRNLGATLQQLGHVQAAADCYLAFLQRGRATADILQNLGNALGDLGLHERAIAAYRDALHLDPSRAALHVHVGNLLEEGGAPDAAIGEYERALAVDPASVSALRCLGAALADQGRVEHALAIFQKGKDSGMKIRAATVLPMIPRSLEELHFWRRRYDAEITRLGEEDLRLDDPPAQAGATPFLLAYHGEDNRALNRELARLYERACPALCWVAPHCRSERRVVSRRRIGVISRFLYWHSIGRTTLGLVEKLSRDQFEVVVLLVPPLRDDEIARRIRAAADRVIELPGTLEGARGAIASLELDVLFYQDVAMDPFTYFLAFSRLAPVQCTSFGHPDTTGITAIDYFVSSDLFETPATRERYSENLFLLRNLGTLAYFYRPQIAAARREDFGLHDGNLYLCPQTLFKFHPEFDALLGAVLRADPQGRLVLVEAQARGPGERLRERLRGALPDVAERIVFIPRQSGANFIRLVAACDVMLDTMHFNGGNTSLEAFAAGTPVVTLPTALQRGRHTAGMYRRMGIADPVARDEDDYVRIAVALGRDRERRALLSREILERNEVLFEDMEVVREFERFFSEASPASPPR